MSKLTVTEMYIEGIKEARAHLKLLDDAGVLNSERVKKLFLESCRDYLEAEFTPGGDFIRGERDFWLNQLTWKGN